MKRGLATLLAAGALLAALRLSPSPVALQDVPAPAGPPQPPGPAGDPASGSARPPADADPEALAARFQREMMRELGQVPAQGGSHAAAAPPADPLAQAVIARWRLRRGAVRDLAGRDVDWTYLDEVFSGRLSGIPSEHRAGLSLAEMDRLGSVPYVVQLRREGRHDELEALGFADEPGMEPWPVCLRTGSCGRHDEHEKSD